MATTVFGTVKIGAASISLDVLLLKTADNTPETGLLATNLTAYYYRQGGSATTSISLSDLVAMNSAYSSGGVKAIGDGSYRLDAPDGMWVAGASWVELTVKSSSSLYKERFTLEAAGTSDIYDQIGIAGAGLTALGDTRIANLDATVSSRGTYSGGAVASVTGNVGGNVAGSVGSVTGAVGSVTGNVGGNVAGSVGSVSGAVGSVTAGVTLAAAGLDAVVVEAAAGAQAAINARQALSLIVCAAPAGIVSGAATTSITVKNPGNTVSRVVATVDADGNRSAVTLTPPA